MDVTRPMKIGSWDLPADIFVLPSIYLTHRRPEIYALPQRFYPDRFITKRPHGPYEFLPFGGGVRRCIGMAFALYEMKIVLATILRTVRLQTSELGSPVAERRNLAIGPRGGAEITILERR